MKIRVTRGDCADGNSQASCISTAAPGEYFNCRSYLEHDTGTNALTMPIYCYIDTPSIAINPEGYPGTAGDGFAGSPPPGPLVSSGQWAYGDVHQAQTVLAGTFDPGAQTITLSGCFADEDDQDPRGNVWFALSVSAHQLTGTAEIYPNQAAGCAGSPTGTPTSGELALVQQPGGKFRDADQDGMGVWYELQDNDACGRRDPFSKNDYYDVGSSGSVARDGVIDLFNDTIGVINNYEPDGYEPEASAFPLPGLVVNYDRPPKITGNSGTWNRGSPDGVIDLFTDQSGVIAQYNPDGMNAIACQ